MSALDERTLEEAVAWLAATSGFNPDAVDVGKLRPALAACLKGRGPPVSRLLEEDPAIAEALLDAVLVRETYFFRQVEHFQYVVSQWLPRWLTRGESELLAWSAGCATGEETYTLAAYLDAALPASFRMDLLGTDLLEQSLWVARQGLYKSHSLRESPQAAPELFSSPQADRLAVLPRIRKRARFVRHNLLDAPPGYFHLILCRHVVMYFSAEGASLALGQLASALAPGGLLVLGTMDTSGPPRGLTRVGSPEMNLFTREPSAVAGAARADLPSAPMTRPAQPAAPAPTGDDAVVEHLKAMVHIERAQHVAAETILRQLQARSPAYIPAVLERGLLFAKMGKPRRAAELMRQVLALAQALGDDALVDGPERLPASYYRASAEAFLERG